MRSQVLICVVLALFLGLTVADTARAFPDVSADRLDYVAVTGLATKGAVQGFTDGTFRPGARVLRGQFVKMLAAAVFLPLGEPETTPFRDLSGTATGPSSFERYVAGAFEAGVVKGKSTLLFEPYAPLTRAQAMTIAARTAQKLKARDFKPLPNGHQGWFARFDDPVHGENAKLAEANHLLAGIDLAGWEPFDATTRSEAALIVWNLVNCFG